MTGMQVIENGIITDSSSIVPVAHTDYLSLTKALNTTYTNNTGKTLFVTVSCICAAPAIGDLAYFIARVDGAYDVDGGGYGSGAVTIAMASAIFSLTYTVRPGQTYRINTMTFGTGAVTLREWLEAY